MLLFRPDRKDKVRVAAFLAVIALHLLAGLLILSDSQVRIPVLHPEQGVIFTFLRSSAPLHPDELPDTKASAHPSSAKKRDAILTPAPQPAGPAVTTVPFNAITLPFIDWDDEAVIEAHRKRADEEAERQRRNLAGPSDAQLEWWKNNAPLVRDHHTPGDTERAAGGEVITWLNDKCFYTTHGIATFGMAQTSKVCKDPPKPETRLFQDMRKQLDERENSSTP